MRRVRFTRNIGISVVMMALFASLLTSCQKKPSGVGSTSGGPPRVHDVLKSPDGLWELTVVSRDPADPDLIGMAWQVYLGPAGQTIDSAHCVFDAQELVPTPTWRTGDTIDVVVTGSKARLADIPPDWKSFETVLGRDGQRHTFPLIVVAR